jgi:DNA (cytosine-5)-methyltransferase 1
MLRAIREIQPSWVVGENVRGLTNWNGGLVFDEVQAELEAQGYEVTPFLLPAASVNAPHRRDRIWFIAYNASYSNLLRFDKCIKHDEVNSGKGRVNAFGDIDKGTINGDDTNSAVKRLEGGTRESVQEGGTRFAKHYDGDASNTSNQRLQRGSVNRSVTPIRKKSYKQPCRFICSEWQNFPIVSPICDGDDGLSDRLDGITFSKWRNESIKAGGNAIVPQVVHQIFKAIEQYNELDKQLTI